MKKFGTPTGALGRVNEKAGLASAGAVDVVPVLVVVVLGVA